MTGTTRSPLRISEDGLDALIEPENRQRRDEYEMLIRAQYEHCHAGDTFEALKHRARFSKLDQGLLRDWMAVAARLAESTRT